MKLIKLENDELSKAVTEGDLYFQVGSRKFMLFEVEDIGQSDYCEIRDPEEEKLLLEAMQDDSESFTTEEVEFNIGVTQIMKLIWKSPAVNHYLN
jgi:hypothetical protein